MLSELNSSIKHGNGSMAVAMKKAVAMMEKAAAMKAVVGGGDEGNSGWW